MDGFWWVPGSSLEQERNQMHVEGNCLRDRCTLKATASVIKKGERERERERERGDEEKEAEEGCVSQGRGKRGEG